MCLERLTCRGDDEEVRGEGFFVSCKSRVPPSEVTPLMFGQVRAKLVREYSTTHNYCTLLVQAPTVRWGE